MADWTYQIIDQSGKERKGNIVAESEAEAKNKLKMDGNMVISLTKATALTKEISFSVGGKVKPRDLSVFCRQFTSMVNAGVTILDTLDMLSDQTENKVMAKAIRGVHAEIQKGETLSDGLKKFHMSERIIVMSLNLHLKYWVEIIQARMLHGHTPAGPLIGMEQRLILLEMQQNYLSEKMKHQSSL